VAKNGRKVKTIALTFAHFLPLISFLERWQKNGRTVKAIAALLFCHFLPLFQKSKKWQKMDDK
jgi:hypothetical protein